jgi:hypothetical protein
MRHALGVHSYGGKRRRWSKPYRNHFVAGEKDVAAWDALVAAGLATKHERTHSELTDGCPLYRVTDAGREVALAGLTFSAHRWARWGYGEPVTP